jgi:hypothetical protein
MQRAIGLSALLISAFLLAGCGGSSVEAKARKVVGDPHATVVSTETVRALNGDPLTIVVMKPSGTTGLGCIGADGGGSVGQTVTSSLVPGCPRSSDAYVKLWGNKLADYGDIGISRFQVAAIARAKAANPRFRIFPSVNQLTVRCTISYPNLGPAGDTLPGGMCATMALPFGKPVRCVSFTEAWRASLASKLHARGWIVTFSRDGQIQSTHLTKHPPQPWSGHQPNICSEI